MLNNSSKYCITLKLTPKSGFYDLLITASVDTLNAILKATWRHFQFFGRAGRKRRCDGD